MKGKINLNIAIILAGGIGSRLNKQIPKQFISVLGKPIIAYTLDKFENNNNIDSILIVSHKNFLNKCKKIVNDFRYNKVKWYVSGGNSFPQSTLNALNFLNDKISYDDIVIVHGSCSPLVTDDVIDDAIKVCKKYGNAMAIQQMNLSTCIKDDEHSSSKAIDRESIVQVQFPLAFRFDYIKDAYDYVIENKMFEELGLHLQYAVFENGGTMFFSKGDDRNFKITTQAELDLFEGYLLLQEKRNIKSER